MKASLAVLIACVAAAVFYAASGPAPNRGPVAARSTPMDRASGRDRAPTGVNVITEPGDPEQDAASWTQLVELEETISADTYSPVSVRSMQAHPVPTSGKEPGTMSLLPDENSTVRKLGGGKYLLELRASKSERWLVIDGGRRGRATRRLDQPQNSPPDPIHIRLQGPAQMTGRVVNARGQPTPKVVLFATRISTDPSEILDASHEPFKSYFMKRGSGQFRQRTVTDAAGQYSFEGLMEGTFRIDASRGTKNRIGIERVPLGHQVASSQPAPASDILFEPTELLFTRWTIEVALDSGPDLAPCDLVIFDAGPAGSTPWARSGWHYSHLPVAQPYATTTGASSRHGHPGGYHYVFAVEEGRQYYLTAQGKGYDPRPQLIQTTTNGAPAIAKVGPPAAAAMGTLRIQLTLGKSEKPEGAGEWYGDTGHYGVIVQDAVSSVPFGVFTPEDLDKGAPELLVPAGLVRIVAAGAPSIERQHGTIWLPRFYGRAEKVVEITSDGVTVVDLELTCNSGALEATLTGEITDANRAFVASEVARMQETSGYVSDEHRGRILRGTLHLESAERRMDVPVTRTALTERNSSAYGYHTLNEWPMGETHRSAPLPPGQYTLRATFPQRPPIEVQVTISDGETTKVTLDFGN